MNKPFDFKKYSLLVAGTSSFFLIFMIVFNLIVDPLDIYRLVKVKGFNEIKPAIAKYTRMSKPIQTEWYQPKTVAFGSSRIELGLNMSHPGWQSYGMPAFNNAVVAAPIIDVKLLFSHAVSTSELETVVIGMDLFQFNVHKNTKKGVEHEEILAVDTQDNKQPLHNFYQILFTLLSRDIFSSGIRTLKKQDIDDHKFTTEGQRINETHIKRRILRKGGQHLYFQKTLAELDSYFASLKCQQKSYQYANDSIDTMRIFRSILNKVKEKNIRLILFFSPEHVLTLNKYDEVGLWPKFEQWKRDLVKEIELANKAYPNSKEIELWDFDYHNQYTTEPVPLPGETMKIMKWHIDSGHYRDTLGDIILDTILLKKDSNAGVLLNAQNIEQHIQNTRKAKEEFKLKNIEIMKNVQNQSNPVLPGSFKVQDCQS